MSEKPKQFCDKSEQIYDFSEEFLIVCPKCALMAKVLPIDKIDASAPRKLICSNCGYNKLTNLGKNSRGMALIEYSGQRNTKSLVSIGGAFDWYFRELLWLQIECCGETLWAYNKSHLEFIEDYVAAELRARTPNINKSLASRLPQWIKSAKNRGEVLKAIGKLKEKLDGKS